VRESIYNLRKLSSQAHAFSTEKTDVASTPHGYFLRVFNFIPARCMMTKLTCHEYRDED
jgi:hypothetical protein